MPQIFARDLTGGTTACLSMASDGAPGDGTSARPVVSAGGQVVAFESAARNLVSLCTTGVTQIFVHDRGAGTTRCASVTRGMAGNGASGNASLSGNGFVVAFISTATNLVAGGLVAGGLVKPAGLSQAGDAPQFEQVFLGSSGSGAIRTSWTRSGS